MLNENVSTETQPVEENPQQPDFSDNLLMQEQNIVIPTIEPTNTADDSSITFDLTYIKQYVDEN